MKYLLRLAADTLVSIMKDESENSSLNKFIMAEVSFHGISSLAYLVLAALSATVLVTKPGRAPKVYFALFFATLFRSISPAATVFNILLPWDIAQFSDSGYRHALVAFSGLPEFLDAWSWALFFLSACLLVRDRQISLYMSRDLASGPYAYCSIAALLALFETVSSGILAFCMNHDLSQSYPFVEDANVGWMYVIRGHLSTANTYLVQISSAFAVGYILYTYRVLKRVTMKDKVISTLVLTVAPAYAIDLMQSLVMPMMSFTIGEENPDRDIRVFRLFLLALTVLRQVFLLIIAFVIVYLGLMRRSWVSTEGGPAARNYERGLKEYEDRKGEKETTQ